jgi:hypothetical protein
LRTDEILKIRQPLKMAEAVLIGDGQAFAAGKNHGGGEQQDYGWPLEHGVLMLVSNAAKVHPPIWAGHAAL